MCSRFRGADVATRIRAKRGDGDNRSRLLNAAANAFAETGFEGTSLRLIAEHADVSFQLIAYYFGSKEDLWLAVVDDLFEKYIAAGRLEIDESADLKQQLKDHFRSLMTLSLEHPQLRKIWVQEHMSGGSRFENSIKPKVRLVKDELSIPHFTRFVELGCVTRFTPEEIALVWGAFVQLNLVYPYYVESLLECPTGSAESINKQVELAVRILTAAEQSPDNTGVGRVSSSASAATRLAALEAENQHLRELVATLSLEKKLLADSQSGRASRTRSAKS